MRVIPICTVDKNFAGTFNNFNASLACKLPFLAAFSSLILLEETKAISDMEKTPLSRIKTNMMSISMIQINIYQIIIIHDRFLRFLLKIEDWEIYRLI